MEPTHRLPAVLLPGARNLDKPRCYGQLLRVEAELGGDGAVGPCALGGAGRGVTEGRVDEVDGVGTEPLIPRHGGYRGLKSFQVAQLVYDLTVRFCERYVDRFSRTRDQMVQAARSGVQNIAEGSQASGTSKKTELKLTNVARASLEELRLDYEDFLRQRGLSLWPREDPRRAALIARRCATADEVAEWVREEHGGRGGRSGHPEKSTSSTTSTQSTPPTPYPELAANAAHAAAFEAEGGFTERLYRVRTARRRPP